MRICRVAPALPSAASPGGSIGIYRLSEHIPEPCLLLARASTPRPALPPHVRLVPLGLRPATLPPALRTRIFDGGGALAAARVQARLVARTLREHGPGLAVALREMRRFHPDLIVCHTLQRLVYGLAARALLGAPLVLYVHNTSEVAALRRLPLLRLLLRIPDRVAAVAPEIARQLAEWLPPDRVWVTSTGVDTEVFTDWRVPRRPQLVTIAHLKWTKGYAHLLEAFPRVLERFPDHRLLVVGDGDERPRIAEAIRARGLEGRVVMTGILQRPDVVRVLNESRLLVLASIHEGLPKALLEALACGTPAVVTDACNAGGIIDTTGLAVPAGDARALADAIIALLSDPDFWERCSRSGPEVAARYDWRAVAARDYAMYRALVPAGARS